MTKRTTWWLLGSLVLLLLSAGVSLLYLCGGEPPTPQAQEDPTSLPALARRQIGVTTEYSAEYVVLDYPGGDVPAQSGVCTDVIIRALRHKGIDLQQLVHEDMKANYRRYPSRKLWRQRATDPSIDHRRVPNLEVFFTRIGWEVTPTPTDNPADYRPGDLVTCYDAKHGRPHIMIVSNRINPSTGVPKVIHNSGKGTQENDALFDFPITGHYRPVYGTAPTVQPPAEADKKETPAKKP